MKVFLVHRDRDMDSQWKLPANASFLVEDLGLVEMLETMANGDRFLFDISKGVVLSSLTDLDSILYRQQVLIDCIEHPAAIKEMYELAVQAIEDERKSYRRIFMKYPSSILSGSVNALELLIGALKKLRKIALENDKKFRSDGFTRFFGMLVQELDNDYFRTVQDHLVKLRFEEGEKICARLGKGNTIAGHTLLRNNNDRQGWLRRHFARDSSSYTFEIDNRDISGLEDLSELKDKGINSVANVLSQSADHILSFFTMLRTELGVYIGCLNLQQRLVQKGEPICFPRPLSSNGPALSAQGLYDVCLSLKLDSRAIGNDVVADGKERVIITGANQGGKTTFLRSIGLGYLMMQCGMFVGAEHFTADICEGIFTHFKRGEDPTMKSGKLDEELGRMSDIVHHIRYRSILLCNESFSSTNEREGSELARQITQAMQDAGIKVFFVTHFFDLAMSLYQRGKVTDLFLRAEREADGRRTYKIIEGEPLTTSYGMDLYRKIFQTAGNKVEERT